MAEQPATEPTPLDEDAAEHLVAAYDEAGDAGPSAVDGEPLPADLVEELDDETLRLAVDAASKDDQAVLLLEMKRRGLVI